MICAGLSLAFQPPLFIRLPSAHHPPTPRSPAPRSPITHPSFTHPSKRKTSYHRCSSRRIHFSALSPTYRVVSIQFRIPHSISALPLRSRHQLQLGWQQTTFPPLLLLLLSHSFNSYSPKQYHPVPCLPLRPPPPPPPPPRT